MLASNGARKRLKKFNGGDSKSVYNIYTDLAPNDFYLFPNVKNKLRGQRFSTREDAVDAFKQHVLEIPQLEWKKCWLHRMQKCIDHSGEYFEKQ